MARYRRYYGYRYRRPRMYRRRSAFTRKIRRSLNQTDCSRIIVSSKPMIETLKYVDMSSISGFTGFYTKLRVFNPLYNLFGMQDENGTMRIPELPAFSRFRDLFDQVKVNAIKIKVQIISQPLPTANSAGIVRTAIDRNGLAPEFATAINSQVDTTASTLTNAINTFESYSSFFTKIINISDLYATGKIFKPTYKDKQWLGCSFKFQGTAAGYEKEALLSDPLFPFKPVFMMQMYLSTIGSNVVQQMTYSVQYDYDLTFKGQRNITT